MFFENTIFLFLRTENKIQFLVDKHVFLFLFIDNRKLFSKIGTKIKKHYK